MSRKPENRLRCENVDIVLVLPAPIGQSGVAQHKLTVSLGYSGSGVLREIAFGGRGKVGHGIDMMLHELGIKLSRAIQGRHPDAGSEKDYSPVDRPRGGPFTGPARAAPDIPAGMNWAQALGGRTMAEVMLAENVAEDRDTTRVL